MNTKKLIQKIERKVKANDKLNAKKKEGEYKSDAFSLPWQKRNKQFKGCNGKATFDPKSFVGQSYGYWNVVQKIKGKVLFNDYRYSNTTSGHQSSIRSVLRQLGIKIDVEVQCRSGLQNFREQALEGLYRDLLDHQLFSARRHNITLYSGKWGHKRTKVKYTDAMRAKDEKAIYKKIKTLRKLGAEFPKALIDAMRSDMIKSDVSERAEAKAKRAIIAQQKKALKPKVVSTDAIDFLNDKLDSTDSISFGGN